MSSAAAESASASASAVSTSRPLAATFQQTAANTLHTRHAQPHSQRIAPQTQQAQRYAPLLQAQQPAAKSQRTFAATQPIPIDLSQSVVMSGGELNYLYRLASLDDSSVSEAAARRDAMRAQSQARYKNWGNTLEAQRSKKKADRLRKLEEIEMKQQAIDAEESEYQQAQQRVVLDRANRLLWQEKDNVKSFHGGLLLASVLKEREAQLELAAAKKAQQRLIDKTYHDIAEEDRLKALEMSRLEQEKRLERSRSAAQQQLNQLAEVRQRQAQERADEVAEGERIKRVAAEAIKESQEEEAKRQASMWAYNQEYLSANEEQLAIKAKRAAIDKLEDDRIAAYAAEKERLTSLRRDHERAKFASKQARFEKMLRRQYDHLSNIQEAEARRTDAQVKEIEKRTDDRHAADKAKAEALKEQTRVSRQAQIDRKAAEAARQRARDEILIAEWLARNAEMADSEHREERATLENALRLQQTLREQMIAKEERIRSELAKEHEEAIMMREAREREDAVFQAYCQQQLADLQVKGRSTIPLQLTLHKDRMKHQRPGNFVQANFR